MSWKRPVYAGVRSSASSLAAMRSRRLSSLERGRVRDGGGSAKPRSPSESRCTLSRRSRERAISSALSSSFVRNLLPHDGVVAQTSEASRAERVSA